MFSSSSALVVTRFCTFRTFCPGRGPFLAGPAGRVDPRSPFPLYLTGRGGCPAQVTRIRGVCATPLLAPGAVLAVEGVEPGPDLVGERVREPVEYGDALAPGRLSGPEVALGQESIAEPGQRVTLAERRAELAVGLDSLGVVGPGRRDVAQVQVDVAEAVQGVGGAATVAGIAVQAQRPLAVGQRPVVLAQVRVQPADPVLQSGLRPP